MGPDFSAPSVQQSHPEAGEWRESPPGSLTGDGERRGTRSNFSGSPRRKSRGTVRAWLGAPGADLGARSRPRSAGRGRTVHRPVATTWPAGAGAGDGGWAGRWGRAAGAQAPLPGSGAASSRRRVPGGSDGGPGGRGGLEDARRVASHWVPRCALVARYAIPAAASRGRWTWRRRPHPETLVPVKGLGLEGTGA